MLHCGDMALAADLPLKARPLKPADASRFWIGMDYLAWSVKGDRLPPLVTTSPTGTPLGQAGVLGPPSTTVLFGDSSVNGGWRSGGRLSAGYWFDPQHKTGIEASFFGLEQASTGFNASSAGNPILARPFLDASTGLQGSSLIAFPGLLSGSVTASETSRLYGAGALYRREIGASSASWGAQRFSLLAGYRFLHASDRMDISSASTGTLFGTPFGVAVATRSTPAAIFTDSISALPASIRAAPGCSNGEPRLRLAPTSMMRRSTARPLHRRRRDHDFAGRIAGAVEQYRQLHPDPLCRSSGFCPESRIQFAPAWRVVASYELLYWTGVQRAGGLIDTTVNPALAPPGSGGGPQRPQAQFDTSSLLAQGFGVGIKHEF
jgi:hypothetical protein